MAYEVGKRALERPGGPAGDWPRESTAGPSTAMYPFRLNKQNLTGNAPSSVTRT